MSDAIYRYLKGLGQKEYEARKPLSHPNSTLQDRQRALEIVNDLLLMMRGFFNCLSIQYGDEVANNYKRFYDQARSKKGLKK